MYTNVSCMDFSCITSLFSSKRNLSCKREREREREKCRCVKIYEIFVEVSLSSVSPFQVRKMYIFDVLMSELLTHLCST